MRIVVLIENQEVEGLESEHGLSFYIEYGQKKYLLDAGSSGACFRNAARLGISVESVDTAVLSHAHYDHGGGFPTFLEYNLKAPIWIREGTAENCYRRAGETEKYIGLPKGMLKACEARIRSASGDVCLDPGVYLIPHKRPGAELRAQKAQMFLRTEKGEEAERFLHEQTLVFFCRDGIVLLNSCSHSGILSIIGEIKDTFPGERILAVFGGFHLMKGSPEKLNETEEEVRRIGRCLLEEDIPYLYTGHCTGTRAFSILKEVLKDRLHNLKTGEWAVFEE